MEPKPNKEFRVIFILGRPGSGKGTQCQLISDKFGFIHMSAGELLRNERKNSISPFKSRLDIHFEEGTTVDPSITVDLLLNAILMHKIQTSCNSVRETTTFLVDGFPPNLENSLKWSAKLKELNLNIVVPFIIYLNATEDICMTRCLHRRRINSGQSNDTEANIRKRFMKFTQETTPVFDWFNKQSLVKRFDADESPERVFEQIHTFLKTFLNA